MLLLLCPVLRIQQRDHFTPDPYLLPQWFLDQLEQLAECQPFGDERVSLGLGFDFYSLHKETMVHVFSKTRSLGLKLITSHYCKNGVFGMFTCHPLIDFEHMIILRSRNTSRTQFTQGIWFVGFGCHHLSCLRSFQGGWSN
jgi:hypothetical protein